MIIVNEAAQFFYFKVPSLCLFTVLVFLLNLAGDQDSWINYSDLSLRAANIYNNKRIHACINFQNQTFER